MVAASPAREALGLPDSWGAGHELPVAKLQMSPGASRLRLTMSPFGLPEPPMQPFTDEGRSCSSSAFLANSCSVTTTPLPPKARQMAPSSLSSPQCLDYCERRPDELQDEAAKSCGTRVSPRQGFVVVPPATSTPDYSARDVQEDEAWKAPGDLAAWQFNLRPIPQLQPPQQLSPSTPAAVGPKLGTQPGEDAPLKGQPRTTQVKPVMLRQQSTPSEKRHPSSPVQERIPDNTVSTGDYLGEVVSAAASRVSCRDLAELRSFRNPPVVVCQIMEAVALLLGVTDYRWATVRKLLDNNFLQRICTLDLAQLSWAQIERLRILLQVPTFSEGTLIDRCPPVVALAAWCNAVGKCVDIMEQTMAEQHAGHHHDLGLGSAFAEEALASTLGSPVSANESPQYIERPDLDGLVAVPDLWQLNQDELAHVNNLCFSREGVGSVTFHGETDCRQLVHCLRDIVVLRTGEVVVYPNADTKPPPGVGLNKPASVVLYGCHPTTQGFLDARSRAKYKKRVKSMTEEKGAEFVDYDCEHGVWQFRVNRF